MLKLRLKLLFFAFCFFLCSSAYAFDTGGNVISTQAFLPQAALSANPINHFIPLEKEQLFIQLSPTQSPQLKIENPTPDNVDYFYSDATVLVYYKNHFYMLVFAKGIVVRNNPLRYLDPMGWSARNIAQTSNNPEDPNNKIGKLSINEVKPGDIGLQIAGTNFPSELGKMAAEREGIKEPYFQHGVIAVKVVKDTEGDVVKRVDVGELMKKPQLRALIEEPINPITGKYDTILGEKLSDYQFFRVTNDPQEVERAITMARNLARYPNKSGIDADTGRLIWLMLTGKDITKRGDTSMFCTEYLNMLYDNKFKDPQKGLTTPYDIYEYIKSNNAD